jgi:probable selenium-dependent hydroxylase accessory protein YqeC
MRALYGAGRARSWVCVAGTTTKVYAEQASDLPGFLHRSRSGDKLVGLPPEEVDGLFATGTHDLVVIEADGSRSRRVKAPAENEPPIPSLSTHVVAVIGADAINRVIEDVAHRPMLTAAVCGCGPYERLTPERALILLTSERGSRKHVPSGARFSVAITRIGPRQVDYAEDLAALLLRAGVPTVLLTSLDAQ